MTLSDIFSPLKHHERDTPKTHLQEVEEAQVSFQENPNEENYERLMSAGAELANDKLANKTTFTEDDLVTLEDIEAVAQCWSLLRSPSDSKDQQPLLPATYTLIGLRELQQNSSESTRKYYPAINSITNGENQHFSEALRVQELGSRATQHVIKVS